MLAQDDAETRQQQQLDADAEAARKIQADETQRAEEHAKRQRVEESASQRMVERLNAQEEVGQEEATTAAAKASDEDLVVLAGVLGMDMEELLQHRAAEEALRQQKVAEEEDARMAARMAEPPRSRRRAAGAAGQYDGAPSGSGSMGVALGPSRRARQGALAAPAAAAMDVDDDDDNDDEVVKGAPEGLPGGSAKAAIGLSDSPTSTTSESEEEEESLAERKRKSKAAASGRRGGGRGSGRAASAAAASTSARGRKRGDKQPVNRATAPAAPATQVPRQPATQRKQPPHGSVASGGASGGGATKETTFVINQKVRAMFWQDDEGESPSEQRFFFPGLVVAVGNGTVDIKYDDNVLVRGVPLAYVQARGEVDNAETPLINLVRQKNMDRHRRMFEALGLGQPLIPPQPSPRKRTAARPAAVARPPRPHRGERATALNSLDGFELGFDFGFGEALLAHQTFNLLDALAAVYGDEAAGELLTHLCVPATSGASGAGGASASAPGAAAAAGLIDPDAPLTVIIYARVGFRLAGCAAIRFHGSTVLTRQVAEVIAIAVMPEVSGQGIGKALLAYTSLVASKVDALVVLWHSDAQSGDGELPMSAEPSSADGVAADVVLTRPPHLPGARLHQLPRHKAPWHELRMAVAQSARAAVREAESGASQAAVAQADRLVADAEALPSHATIEEAMVDDDLARGQYIALWAEVR